MRARWSEICFSNDGKFGDQGNTMLLSSSLVSFQPVLFLLVLVFGFLLPVLASPVLLSIFACCCSLLIFVAFQCPLSLFLVSTGLELEQMNKKGKETCSFIAFCFYFWFWGHVSICLLLLIARPCFLR